MQTLLATASVTPRCKLQSSNAISNVDSSIAVSSVFEKRQGTTARAEVQVQDVQAQELHSSRPHANLCQQVLVCALWKLELSLAGKPGTTD